MRTLYTNGRTEFPRFGPIMADCFCGMAKTVGRRSIGLLIKSHWLLLGVTIHNEHIPDKEPDRNSSVLG